MTHLLKNSILSGVILLKKVSTLKHTVNNALFIQNKTEPYEVVEWMRAMNKEHICSHLIDQDVLLVTGENDAFQPRNLARFIQSGRYLKLL